MSFERVRLLISSFRDAVRHARHPDPDLSPWLLEANLSHELLRTLLLTRHLDHAAHELKAAGHGHYTICSAGHEANAVFGRLTRCTDPALLHYRSTAVQLQRAASVPSMDAVRDVALSLVASSDDPASGGRHKVLGHRQLGIIPQTSTIASHLPRALGIALAIERKSRLKLAELPPPDALVLCSFGDASSNHSTALGTFNAAAWSVHQHLKVPLLFLCEDNGLGISVRTPRDWIKTQLASIPHFQFREARGWDLQEVYTAAAEATTLCRETRRPIFFHLKCARLLGHAGSDVDTTYRSRRELEEATRRDPLRTTSLAAMASRRLTVQDVLNLDRECEERVQRAVAAAVSAPKHHSLASLTAVVPVVAPGWTPSLPTLPNQATCSNSAASGTRITLAQGINQALTEALHRYPGTLVFGEDVAKKGGVYGITKGLLAQFGPARVFNTLLDEQTILGMALGCAIQDLLPIPEIQYLAYLHNAEDQLRGEATTLPFFSNRAYDNPMVVRIPGLAYQRGFGGHFHNDNSLAVLRDIPWLLVAIPARGDDALELYRTALELAHAERRVVVIVEPIALYHQRDLIDSDGLWASRPTSATAAFNRARVYPAPTSGVPAIEHLTIVTYGNGVRMSLQAAQKLREEGLCATILDLRWLVPLPIADVIDEVVKTQKLLIVDEGRKTGSVSETLIAELLDHGIRCPIQRITGQDCLIPLGDAANIVLIQESAIIKAARHLCEPLSRAGG